jgi:hypothetical protein
MVNAWPNRFVEWTHSGGHRSRHSSMLSAPCDPFMADVGRHCKHSVHVCCQHEYK